MRIMPMGVSVAAVVGVLVGAGFEQSPEAADRRGSLLCCSLLDLMLFCESHPLCPVFMSY